MKCPKLRKTTRIEFKDTPNSKRSLYKAKNMPKMIAQHRLNAFRASAREKQAMNSQEVRGRAGGCKPSQTAGLKQSNHPMHQVNHERPRPPVILDADGRQNKAYDAMICVICLILSKGNSEKSIIREDPGSPTRLIGAPRLRLRAKKQAIRLRQGLGDDQAVEIDQP